MANNEAKVDTNKRWILFNSMFKELGLVRQHLDSFNDFIERGLQSVVEEIKVIEPEDSDYYVKLEKIEVEKPIVREADGSQSEIYPMEARIRNLTYASKMYLHMKPIHRHPSTGVEAPGEPTSVFIGYLPIMLKSNKCHLYGMTPEKLIEVGEDPRDPGGYFIINGSERVIVTQEDLAPNRILVEKTTGKGNVTSEAKVFSVIHGFRAPVTVEHTNDGQLRVSFPSMPRKVSLILLMRALGIERDDMIATAISPTPKLRAKVMSILMRETEDIDTTEAALDYIGKRVAVGQTKEYRINRATQVLDKYLLPHLGSDEESRIKKAFFLARMAQELLEIEAGIRKEDDKDHYANKRLKLAGDLLLLLFRVAFHALCRDIKYQLERVTVRGKRPNLRTAVRADLITERLRHALATGNWVGGKSGVSQLLDRTNYMSALSHLRRVVSPLSRSQPHFEARDLHPTQFGKICVTPDTMVLMADSEIQKPIGSIERDYKSLEVTTVDVNTHEEVISPLIAYQRLSARSLNKRVIEIKTITGRVIRATEDHPFFTDKGWIEAGDLKLTDKVLIRPTLNPIQENKDDYAVFTILDKDRYLNGKWTKQLEKREQTLLESDIKELESLGLLPLTSDNEKLHIITRLMGIILTDGHVGNTIEFYTGSEKDAKAIMRDIMKLGFSTNPIRQKRGILKESNDTATEYHTYFTTKGGSFKRLMMALGIPYGKRTEQAYEFPNWLLNVPKTAKREFLAAFMGGDGSAPWFYLHNKQRGDYRITLPNLEIHKDPQYVDSQIKFFDYLKELFEEFDISIKQINTKEVTKTNKIAVELVFNNSKDNILNLCKNVGYRYAIEKQIKAQLISEYLMYRNEEIKQRIELKNKAIELYEQGIEQNEIAKQLDVSYRTITSIIYRRNEKMKTNRPRGVLSVDEFFELTDADINTGMLYVPLKSIRVINDEDIVCDFTTAKDTHSFIANGFVTHNCPNETPEGPNCGLVKNLALQAYISVGVDEKEVEKILEKELGLRTVQPKELADAKSPVRKLLANPENSKVFLNGRFIGIVENGEEFRRKVIEYRRAGKLYHEVNLAYYDDTKEVVINCDAGRVRRPLIIVDKGKPRLTDEIITLIETEKWEWSDLIRNQIIEYVDAEEEENLFVAIDETKITEKTTHMEIAPSTMLGICASLIPFPEHNRSDRNVYEAGMAKQALGIFAANFQYRLDTRAHILHYPQRPIVKTHGIDAINFDSRPAGQNFVVAILSYEGYNMEDAILINKASIERGLGRSTFYRTYEAEERKYPNGQEDTFEIPDETVRGYKDEAQYVHLGEDGIIEPEIEVDGNKGEVLIGRTSPPRFLEEYTEFDVPPQNRRETSKAMRHGEKGISDLVVITETSEGNKLVKVRVRSDRIPEIGDKFASRHGQKGVIGLIIPQEDMPFTRDGIVPDIIVNPHAVPSRMTVGHLMELLAGKLGAQIGKEIYATAFSNVTIKELQDALAKVGLHPEGREVLYDGKTGKRLEGTIFVGCQFYQKLHHLVADKIHARARGPIQMLTRQPTEGRAREGGLRFGEMERDCLIGHGTSILLKERLLDESDKTEALICSKCGFLAMYDRNHDRYLCPVCKEETTVSKVVISYAFKLLLQELMSLCIAPHVELEDVA